MSPKRRTHTNLWRTLLGITLISVFLFTPLTETLLVRWSLNYLERQHGMSGSIGQLDLDFRTLQVTVGDIRVATDMTPDSPFLQIKEVNIDFPWSMIWSSSSRGTATVQDPAVSVVRQTDGSWNLPDSVDSSDNENQNAMDSHQRLVLGNQLLQNDDLSSLEPADTEQSSSLSLPLLLLRVNRLTTTWLDASNGNSVTVAPISFELTGNDGVITGPLVMDGEAIVSYGDKSTLVTLTDGNIQLSGTALDVQQLTLDAPEGQFAISGGISDLVTNPTLDLSYNLRLSLAESSPWLSNQPAVGTLTASGTVTGPVGTLIATAQVNSPTIKWSDFEVNDTRLAVHFTPNELVLEALQATIANGALEAEGHFNLDGTNTNRLSIRWDDVEMDELSNNLGLTLPERIKTTAEGFLDATWTESNGSDLTVSARNQFGDEAGLHIQSRAGQWWLSIDESLAKVIRVSGTVGVQLSTSLGESPVTGSIRLQCNDMSRCSTFVQPWHSRSSSAPLKGSITLDFVLNGTLGTPQVTGKMATSSLNLNGTTPTNASALFTIDSTAITVDHFTVNFGPNQFTSHGRFFWLSEIVDIEASAQFGQLAEFQPLFPAGWFPAGLGRANVTVKGPLGSLRGRAHLQFQTVEIIGQQFDSVTIDLSSERSTIVLNKLRLLRDRYEAKATGWYDTEGATFSGSFETAAFPITSRQNDSDVGIPIAAQLSMSLNMHGSIDDPNVKASVRLTDTMWSDYMVGLIDVHLHTSDQTATATASFADANTVIKGTFDFDNEQNFEVTAVTKDADVSTIFSDVEWLSGTVAGEVLARGSLQDLRNTSLQVELSRLSGSVGDVNIEIARPASITYESETLEVNDFDVTLGSTRVKVNGALTSEDDRSLTAQIAGNVEDFGNVINNVINPNSSLSAITSSGTLSLLLTGTGKLDNIDIVGNIDLARAEVALANMDSFTDISLSASIRDKTLFVEQIQGHWAGATLEASTSVPFEVAFPSLPLTFQSLVAESNRSAHIHAEIQSLTPEALANFVDSSVLSQITGKASLAIDLELPRPSWKDVHGSLTLTNAAFLIAGIPISQVRPTAINLANGQATVESFTWGNELDRINVDGVIGFEGTPTVNLGIDGTLDLRAVSAFLPAVETSGTARILAQISQETDSSDIQGRIDLANAELRVEDPSIVVSGLDGTLALTGDTIAVETLRGNINGGRFNVSGSWSFDGNRDTDTLSFTSEGVPLEIPRGFRSETEVSMQLSSAEDALELSGTATILRGEYKEPLSLADGLLSTLRPQAQTAGVERPSNSQQTSRPIELDVRIIAAESIFLDNNYVSGEISTDIHVGGTVAVPTVTGRLEINDGSVARLGNRVYEIESGAVDLIDPNGIEPILTLVARTRAGNYDVRFSANGGIDDLTTELRSDPPLSEADIASVLISGRPLDQTSVTSATGMPEQVIGFLSTEFLGQVSNNVGLDVEVNTSAPGFGSSVLFDSALIANELNPGARLTVARDLSEQVQLIFSRSLRDSDLAWIVDYRPRNDVEVRSLFYDERERAYEFRHALSFGAPPNMLTRPPHNSIRQTISRISFEGTPGFPSTELENLLALRPGDLFDFGEWQDDRKQLEDFYLANGLHEAIIRTQRIDSQNQNLVSLVYDITRGPHTSLKTTGFELPAMVTNDLERVWQHAVFDNFLVQELSNRITRYLFAEGYITAEAAVTINRNDQSDHVQVTIEIEPGSHISKRTLVFYGLTNDEEHTVREFVASRGLNKIAWTDQSAFVTTIENWYRERGWLETVVTSEPITVKNGVAHLPIHLRTGRRYQIGTITLAGFSTKSESELKTLVSLSPGDAYSSPALSDAKDAIETSYFESGFANARVAVTSTRNNVNLSVDIEIDIHEGLEHLIDDITIEGGSRTNPDIITSALLLEQGEAVTPSTWTLARKRLYDTGLFRSVNLEPSVLTSKTSDGYLPVSAKVTLEEWPSYRIRYGLRLVDTLHPLNETRRLRLGAAADISRQNLLGRGLTVGLSSRADIDSQVVRAFLTIPRLFGRTFETNLFASRQRNALGSSNADIVTNTMTLTAEQRVRPLRNVTLSYSANLDKTRTLDRLSNPQWRSETRASIARFDGNILYDSRNNPFDANRGTFHSSNLEFGLEFGGLVKFTKYRGQHYWYLPIGPLVLASAGRIGLATGLGSELLPFQRFFAGGGNTVRGYIQDGLGPVNVFNRKIGGNGLMILNQEIRIPVAWRFHAVGFLDAGNVFDRISSISLRSLKVSAGIGLRVESPIGLVRLDYGFPFERFEHEPAGRFFFSLGQAF